MKIKLGDYAEDKVTGFRGIITGKFERLHSTPKFAVQSAELFKGRPIDEQWFFEDQLERLSKTKLKEKVAKVVAKTSKAKPSVVKAKNLPKKRGRKPKSSKVAMDKGVEDRGVIDNG